MVADDIETDVCPHREARALEFGHWYSMFFIETEIKHSLLAHNLTGQTIL